MTKNHLSANENTDGRGPDSTAAALQRKNEQLLEELSVAERKIQLLERECKAVASAYDEVLSSTSWRITKPVRSAGAILKKLKSGRVDLPTAMKKSKAPVDVIVLMTCSDISAVSRTVRSLKAQTIRNWRLIVYLKKENVKLLNSLQKRYLLSSRISVTAADTPPAEPPVPEKTYVLRINENTLLMPNALEEFAKEAAQSSSDLLYSDSVQAERNGQSERTICRPAFAPDTLRSTNYIGSVFFAAYALWVSAGLSLSDYPGAYETILRLSENARKLSHIRKALYSVRTFVDDAADVPGENALENHLVRLGLSGRIDAGTMANTFHISYDIQDSPLVSIIIPNKDHMYDLKNCLESILRKTSYENYEIIIADNNSVSEEIREYYSQLSENSKLRILSYPGPFNYSAINNYAVKQARGSVIVLLNNDTELISPDWLSEMLMYAQRHDIGAVGAMLYYPDDTIQHAGIEFGTDSLAKHQFKFYPRNSKDCVRDLSIVRNVSGVTGACLMIRKNLWNSIGGLNENYAVAFNDADLCLRLRKAGYRNVWTPFTELYHFESKSRGFDISEEDRQRFNSEVARFEYDWSAEIEMGDPYYTKE